MPMLRSRGRSSQGLINGVGTPEGVLLAPHGYASRAQVATILMAYCDR